MKTCEIKGSGLATCAKHGELFGDLRALSRMIIASVTNQQASRVLTRPL